MAAKTAQLQGLIFLNSNLGNYFYTQECETAIHTPESMSFEDFMKHMMRDKKVLSVTFWYYQQVLVLLKIGRWCASDIIKQAIDFCRTL